MASGSRIQTYTGLLVDLLALAPSDIRLEDIGHALGNICRFTGHTSRFYSVLEHSINVALVAEYLLAQAPPCDDFREFFIVTKLAALLHDASEAYLNDVVRPLKVLPEYAFYRDTEERLQTTIYEKYIPCGAVVPSGSLIMDIVKRSDDIMLGIEARDLMGLRPGNYIPKEGKEWKPTPGAQRAWDDTWTRYTKLIPDELYYRVSVAQAPPHKRNGERRAVLGDYIQRPIVGELGMGVEWLEMVMSLLAARSPGVVFE